MSKKNGDKARFGKEQKKKLLRRARTLALRQTLAGNTVMHVEVASGSPTTPTEAAPTRTPDGIL